MVIPQFGNALPHLGHNTAEIVGPQDRKDSVMDLPQSEGSCKCWNFLSSKVLQPLCKVSNELVCLYMRYIFFTYYTASLVAHLTANQELTGFIPSYAL